MNGKILGGVSTDGSRKPITRYGRNMVEVWVRQVTFEDGIEADLVLWADGTVAVTVKRMNSGREILRWRSDKCDCRAAELNAPAHSEDCTLRKARP